MADFAMTIAEKIRFIAKRRGVSIKNLAEKMLGQNPKSFYHKLQRDNFSEKETKEIAKALGCSFKTVFIDDETGEEI